ncbi:unnamed protein product [Musa textilis]
MRVLMACRMYYTPRRHGFRTTPDNHLPRLPRPSSYSRKGLIITGGGNVFSRPPPPNSEPPNSLKHDKLQVKVSFYTQRFGGSTLSLSLYKNMYVQKRSEQK